MSYRHVRAALLLGFALLIAKLFAAGEMVKYMSPTLDPLTALTGVALAAMGVIELRGGLPGQDADGIADGDSPAGVDGADRSHAHSDRAHGDRAEQAVTSLLLVVPLALGLLVTPRALGASALGGEEIAGRLLSFGPGPARVAAASAPPPSQIEDVPDLLRYLTQHGENGVGQRVVASGLVARSARLAPEELGLLRFQIAHCVADARPIGLLVVGGRQGAHADPSWAPDQWVRVEGTLAQRERDGDRLVAILADTIVPVKEPSNPYLTSWQ